MAEKPYWSAKHVRTLAELPKVLTIGRAYFIDDEHYIIIDHGAGPVIYGNRAGQQGQPGEPIPILQAQIDYLAQASVNQTALIDYINNKRKQDDAEIISTIEANETAHAEKYSQLQNDIATVDKRRYEDLLNIYASFEELSKSIITLTEIASTIADNLRSTENALLKLIIEDERVNPATPLAQNDIITTADGYSWTVTNISTKDGEIDLILNLRQ